jgi:hypothetical protein
MNAAQTKPGIIVREWTNYGRGYSYHDHAIASTEDAPAKIAELKQNPQCHSACLFTLKNNRYKRA